MLRRSILPAVLGTLALSVSFGCRQSLDDEPDSGTTNGRACKVGTTTECTMGETQSSIAWLEANAFSKSCAFSGCHNGSATTAGRINFKDPGQARDDLVNVDSMIATGRKLVVPGKPKESYLLMIMQHFPPDQMEPTPVAPPPNDIGFMPQNAGGAVLCCQKLDAIERWITAGAMP
jgi:hypothetical protein